MTIDCLQVCRFIQRHWHNDFPALPPHNIPLVVFCKDLITMLLPTVRTQQPIWCTWATACIIGFQLNDFMGIGHFVPSGISFVHYLILSILFQSHNAFNRINQQVYESWSDHASSEFPLWVISLSPIPFSPTLYSTGSINKSLNLGVIIFKL